MDLFRWARLLCFFGQSSPGGDEEVMPAKAVSGGY